MKGRKKKEKLRGKEKKEKKEGKKDRYFSWEGINLTGKNCSVPNILYLCISIFMFLCNYVKGKERRKRRERKEKNGKGGRGVLIKIAP